MPADDFAFPLHTIQGAGHCRVGIVRFVSCTSHSLAQRVKLGCVKELNIFTDAFDLEARVEDSSHVAISFRVIAGPLPSDEPCLYSSALFVAHWGERISLHRIAQIDPLCLGEPRLSHGAAAGASEA